MKNETKKSTLFGSIEISQHFNKFLYSQTTILKGVVNEKLNKKAEDVKIVLASVCNTATAIVTLGDRTDYFYNESVMLSRSVIEKLINFCYLMCCDESSYEKFVMHALYKSYHNLNKEKFTEKQKLKMEFKGKDEIVIDENKNLKRALELFPKKKMSWTKLDVNKRVNLIDQKTNINTGIFLLNTLSIYSDASEALHGSLYGCSFHTFAYDPTIDHKNKAEVNINLQKNITLLYWQLGSMIHEVIKLLNNSNNIYELFNGSEKNNNNALEIMEKIMGDK